MRSRLVALCVAVAFGVMLGGAAWADRGYDGRGYARHAPERHWYPARSYRHLDVDLYFGWPLYWPRYYRYYDDPVIITVPSEPTVYVERSTERPTDDSDYWYYCPSSRTYYPYVKDCREDWMKVVPQPPPDRR